MELEFLPPSFTHESRETSEFARENNFEEFSSKIHHLKGFLSCQKAIQDVGGCRISFLGNQEVFEMKN